MVGQPSESLISGARATIVPNGASSSAIDTLTTGTDSHVIINVVSWISSILDSNIVWLVPVIIVLIQFLLKLVIGGTSLPDKWKIVIELPTDICILSIAFLSSIFISKQYGSKAPTTELFLFFGITLISFYICHVSPKEISKISRGKASLYLAANSTLAILLLIYSVAKLLGA